MSTRIGLVSDIHGDIDALELAWSHLKAMGVSQVVCAGDLVGYGPFPDRVVAFLMEHEVPSVRGNHDRWALQRGHGVADDFGGGTPNLETLEFLHDLPSDLTLEVEGRVVVVVHGSPRSDMEFVSRPAYTPARLRADLLTLRCQVLVVGHTHTPMWYRDASGLVLNPGSVLSVTGRATTSRTFAVLDVAGLSATFHEVATGQAIDVAAWTDEEEAPTA